MTTRTRFDKCLSLQIDACQDELNRVQLLPASRHKLKRLVRLRKRLRRLERKIRFDK